MGQPTPIGSPPLIVTYGAAHPGAVAVGQPHKRPPFPSLPPLLSPHNLWGRPSPPPPNLGTPNVSLLGTQRCPTDSPGPPSAPQVPHGIGEEALMGQPHSWRKPKTAYGAAPHILMDPHGTYGAAPRVPMDFRGTYGAAPQQEEPHNHLWGGPTHF